ncbi:MAG: septum formation initiator family protein [bacterium]|nr:septum formation initiator family protein [bacterium]
MSKNKWSRIIMILGIIIIAGIGAYNFIFGEAGYLKNRRLQKEVDNLTVEIEDLKKDNAEKAEAVAGLNKDRTTIESVARDKYLMVKPEEEIVKFQSIDDNKQ